MNNIEFKLIREDLHLTVADLADLWGVNVRNVQRWEQGKIGIPENRQEQLLSYYDMVYDGVRHFAEVVNEQADKHGLPDKIILLSYGPWDYDGDFPSYKIHNALLIKCKSILRKMNLKSQICPFVSDEYDKNLGQAIPVKNIYKLGSDFFTNLLNK